MLIGKLAPGAKNSLFKKMPTIEIKMLLNRPGKVTYLYISLTLVAISLFEAYLSSLHTS